VGNSLAKKEIKEIKEADVLVIGGGLGGCMAALHAHHQGANVIVVEKANVRRSGGAGTGNDHFRIAIPAFRNGRLKTPFGIIQNSPLVLSIRILSMPWPLRDLTG
jgi:glycine/D-amino acid oxidase-like deaminating enzyme